MAPLQRSVAMFGLNATANICEAERCGAERSHFLQKKSRFLLRFLKMLQRSIRIKPRSAHASAGNDDMRLPRGRSFNFGSQPWNAALAEHAGALGSGAQSGRQLGEISAFGSNPGQLRMWTYIPPGLPAGAPLVVVLHGCGQSASGYTNGTGWNDLADRYGFGVLAPEQTPQNNPNGCFNWFQPEDTARGHGEAASIKQMIDTMLAIYGFDEGRVFVTGLSAGGAMTSVMLATYPETFAGGAIIAGLPYGAAPNLSEALRAMRKPGARSPGEWGDAVRHASSHDGSWPKVSIWHGDDDFTVSAANAEASIDQWTDVLGVSRADEREESANGYQRRIWLDAKGAPVLEAYMIKGMGHGTPILTGSTPDACGTPAPFILPAGISSSVRIAEFFGLGTPAAAREDLALDSSTPAAAPGNFRWFHRSDPTSKPATSPEAPRGSRVGRVISDALRAAGLLK
jgi:poly(hydroxyalkanoate) depolymerase family esterase